MVHFDDTLWNRRDVAKPASGTPQGEFVTDVRIAALDPAAYRRSPWKNGGGVTIDIADAYRPGAKPGDWDGVLWRLGRTEIPIGAPFSDLSGYDRLQVVVAGRGLVLETAAGEIDLREPLRPVRFRGEPPITSRLEAGPVEVVNLIGARSETHLDLRVLDAGTPLTLSPGTHVVYAPSGPATLDVGVGRHVLHDQHALCIDLAETIMMRGAGGVALVASIGSA
ncbi:MAG TPA: HutD family protein [Stellaceae bacterium]